MPTVPPALAPYADRLRIVVKAAPTPRCVLDGAMTAFSAEAPAIRGALVSEWSMYYFAALIVPTIVSAVCAGRHPAVAIDEMSCELDPEGRVRGFWTTEAAACRAAPFDPLVAGHLEPMITFCAGESGVSPRVLWSNAAVILDWAVCELSGAAAGTAPLAAAAALLDRHPRLGRPFRLSARRERKVCCLRYRLPHANICEGICPRERIAGR